MVEHGKTLGEHGFIPVNVALVMTRDAINIYRVRARLPGRANPQGSETTGWFRYSTTDPGSCNDSVGTMAPDSGTSLGSGTAPVAYGQLVTGLTPGTTYYFCAIASNADGTAFGRVLSFTTARRPAAQVVGRLAPAHPVVATRGVKASALKVELADQPPRLRW